MSPARGSQAAGHPNQPSIFAAENLSPAYPRRAAWGTAGSLRAWQAEALDAYMSSMPEDFLAVATPGAGKTTFALRIATELLSRGDVHQVTVVAPTEHLKYQWAEAAARVGIHLDPSFTNSQGALGSRFDGVALTYAQVAANANLHRARTDARRTLVILDEIHHGGDAKSWGDAVREAFTPARRRLALTGTPFRSDESPIPFVRYDEEPGGIKRSHADYSYGYAEALRDGVVRPVMFMTYSGQMRWRTRAGDEVAARLGEPLTKDLEAQAWRTALDPSGQWVPAVLAAADQRLSEVRRQVPDAGGLVIATDQSRARAYAAQLRAITGQAPTVVLSDDSGASSRIEAFSASRDRWLVAVRMVSEGVDVPRLAVGVYATSTSTPLFFAQAVGRFVRSRAKGETASVFLPSVTPLLGLANEMEVARDHVLGRPRSNEDDLPGYPEDRLVAEANKEERASDDLFGAFEAMDSTAEFDRVLFDGGEFGTGAVVGSVEEQEYLGLPGLLEPEQVTALLRQRQDKQIRTQKRESAAAARRRANSGVDDARRRQAARKELSQLVAAWARRSGQPHGVVHNDLRRVCGGPEVAQASTEEIEKRVQTLRRWFVGKR
ncbi:MULTISPECIES: DEAD/DEAH box helicase [unclassified Actinomyces]|uniref:DEAD/DEAH box helicase n=2 Tax=Actinomyces TaxID=1654 RepID=UPI002016BC3C|nr:DEAD/DEAH box helicase [Actinomyces sp. 187325]MCL3776761.1 DEAD/DEAH box helicase [Actinomyces sp. AC-20-1]MCL3789715.1 DEAD/DEAH box helicase [Actinomyces sp. 187325]MCL3791900.1 DEAD/DEAH box helicase [Actinomyces sp. 186855]MCL3794439.1 DEAD/DEAH box helicase [Actinomyces sp. 217892]